MLHVWRYFVYIRHFPKSRNISFCAKATIMPPKKRRVADVVQLSEDAPETKKGKQMEKDKSDKPPEDAKVPVKRGKRQQEKVSKVENGSTEELVEAVVVVKKIKNPSEVIGPAKREHEKVSKVENGSSEVVVKKTKNQSDVAKEVPSRSKRLQEKVVEVESESSEEDSAAKKTKNPLEVPGRDQHQHEKVAKEESGTSEDEASQKEKVAKVESSEDSSEEKPVAKKTKNPSEVSGRGKPLPKKVAKEQTGRGKRQQEKVTKVESESEESEEEPVVKKTKKPSKIAKEPVTRGKRQPKMATKLSDESDEEEAVKKPKASSSKQGSAPKTLLNKTETSYASISFACDKPNKLGKTPNVCISSWNVDGLRAWLKKNGLTYIEYEKPDILCLQETKCSTEKLPSEIKDLKGYKQYWHNSAKEGYAGVGLLTRTEPISVVYGINDEDQDSEGRCVTAEFDKYYVVSVYVPNAGRKLVTLPKRLEWNTAFDKFIETLDKKKPVIICGDMNVAHSEIDLANPKTNTKNAGFTKEEREGMTGFLSNGFIDTFRSFYSDKTGAYTFWSYMANARAKNVGWRLDYFIVSKRILDNVCDNVIRSEVFGSDHCPLSLFMNI